MIEKAIETLEQHIRERSERRGLHTDLARLRYTNEYLYSGIGNQAHGRVLYVGIGHGHDAILAVLEGLAGTIIGVDPYYVGDGSCEDVYQELLSIIDMFGLGHRVRVERKTIQDYLEASDRTFDAVICSDILHHAFVTQESLSKSPEFCSAVELFAQLASITRAGGRLAVSELERYGLRPILSKIGVLKKGKYRTKQARGQWVIAAERGGWSLSHHVNYIPWQFRKQNWLWSGFLGRVTLCDRYFLFLNRREIV